MANYRKGDVNMDGLINQNDLTLIQNHWEETELITDETQLSLADINNDGKINGKDLNLVTALIEEENKVFGFKKNDTAIEVCTKEEFENITEAKLKKKYIFIGDSYGTGNSVSDGTRKAWTAYVPEYLGLAEEDYYVNASDGAGFKHGAIFKNMLSNLANSINDKETITNIVVCGGFNDKYYEKTEILAAIEEFCTYAKTTFINAKIQIGHIGWSSIYQHCWNMVLNSYPAYRQCIKYGAEYLEGVEYSNHKYDNFVSDNYHPNDDGQMKIAAAITQAIKTGSANVYYGFNSITSITNSMTHEILDKSDGSLTTSLINGMGTFHNLSSFALNCNNETFTANNWKTIFQYSNEGVFNGSMNANVAPVHISAYAVLENNSHEILDCLISFYQGSADSSGPLTFCCLKFLGMTGATKNIASLLIPAFHINTHAMYC